LGPTGIVKAELRTGCGPYLIEAGMEFRL